MSEAALELNFVEQLKQQHAGFVQQRDQVKTQFEQLQGAIFACEQLIIKHTEQASNASADCSE